MGPRNDWLTICKGFGAMDNWGTMRTGDCPVVSGLKFKWIQHGGFDPRCALSSGVSMHFTEEPEAGSMGLLGPEPLCSSLLALKAPLNSQGKLSCLCSTPMSTG